MERSINELVAFVGNHPDWAAALIAVTVFGESFVIIGLFFPGTALLVAAGALAATGAIDPLTAIAAGFVGGVLGDGASFWLGQRFGPIIPKLSWFQRRPDLLIRGKQFFALYGGASVFVGRFFWALRSVTPLVAGMMGMSLSKFYAANILSAAIWAPGLVLSGMLLHRYLAGGGRSEATLLIVLLIAAVVIALALWRRARGQNNDDTKPLT